MAKIEYSGLITKISGSCGKFTFATWKGIPYVRLKGLPNHTNTEYIKRIKANYGKLNNLWKSLDNVQRVLWGHYAKMQFPKKMSGFNIFMGVNARLLSLGLKEVLIPPITRNAPPSIKTDLTQFQTFTDKIEFNIWLHHQYYTDCYAEIILRTDSSNNCKYIAVVPAPEVYPDKKTKIVIDKIRIKDGVQIVEKSLPLKTPRIIIIQMKTVSSNGRISCPSAKYQIKLLNE